ncbi:MAG: hypothetical protein WA125_10120 [Desulfosporosinus sp.]
MTEGAIIADAVTAPFAAVKNRSGLQPGGSLLVYGGGGLDLNLVQIGTAMGASGDGTNDT